MYSIRFAMTSNKLLYYSLLIFSVTVAYGDEFTYTEIDLKGSCPKIKYINSFSLNRIVGWYYQAFSSIDNSLCYQNEGQTLYAAQLDERTINLQMCCRSATNRDVAFCGSKIGSGTATATNNTCEFLYQTGTDSNNLLVYVLDTNYDDLTVAYGCRPGSRRGSRRKELIFVLSRDYKLSKSFETRARNVLQRNGIEFSNAKPVTQGQSIPYTPNSRSCGRRPF